LKNEWDIIVVGAGHAGCEAALAAARMGLRTALLTINLDQVAQMSCNPAIGGIGKGQLVREIDALGGEMGKVTDATGIQFRMLNTSKGPAVQALRAQADRKAYRAEMKRRVESQPHLDLLQEQVQTLLVENGKVRGAAGLTGTIYPARAVILATGTFLRGLIHIGDTRLPAGRMGEPASENLSLCLMKLGLEVQRLKTCTPPRVNGKTVELDRLPRQEGDEPPQPFSYSTPSIQRPQWPCYMTWTNARAHDIIRQNLHRAPILSGQMRGAGPRYCPSIEDKIDAFPDRDRHQVFLEPEGTDTPEMYLNGLFTSLPCDVQAAMLRAIPGLENAQITRYGYAIEYDFCPPTQLWPSLESKKIEGLFCAGQINGTSGYEEAAAQGLVAGINAARKLHGDKPLILGRDEAYIGVLIDDLVTKGTGEPYRIFSSRAEYRLLLRHGNADRRLMRHGHRLGLISDEQMQALREKEKAIGDLIHQLRTRRGGPHTLAEILQRPAVKIHDVLPPDLASARWDADILSEAEVEVKYAGYIARQARQVERFHRMEDLALPQDLDYKSIKEISAEARDKLSRIRPQSLGQASRISGVSPADIAVLMVHLRAHHG
jgi:tRNA uridine 5-carboxymethylaminomethyl modification enzyme